MANFGDYAIGISSGIDKAISNIQGMAAIKSSMARDEMAQQQMGREAALQPLKEEQLRTGNEAAVINKNILAQKLKQEKWFDERVDLYDQFDRMGLTTPGVRARAEKEASLYLEPGSVQSNGKARPLISRRAGIEVLKKITSDPKLQIEFETIGAQDIQNEIDSLKESIPEGADGTNKKVQETLTKIKNLTAQREQLQNVIKRQQDMIAGVRDKKPFYDAEGKSPMLMLNPNTDEIPPGYETEELHKLKISERIKADKEARDKADKPIQIRQVDLGDRVEIYENGVLARTVAKNKAPGTEGTNKPQQTQFIDEESGKPLIFDPSSGTYKIADVRGTVAPRMVNPSATEREKGAQFEVIRRQINRIEKMFKPEYVGIISGKLGALTQLSDKDEAGFRQVILDVKDSLLRARSGAQINEREYDRLSKLVPDMSDSIPMFKGKMKEFKTTFSSIVDERKKAQKAGGVYIRGESKDPSQMTDDELKKSLGL